MHIISNLIVYLRMKYPSQVELGLIAGFVIVLALLHQLQSEFIIRLQTNTFVRLVLLVGFLVAYHYYPRIAIIYGFFLLFFMATANAQEAFQNYDCVECDDQRCPQGYHKAANSDKYCCKEKGCVCPNCTYCIACNKDGSCPTGMTPAANDPKYCCVGEGCTCSAPCCLPTNCIPVNKDNGGCPAGMNVSIDDPTKCCTGQYCTCVPNPDCDGGEEEAVPVQPICESDPNLVCQFEEGGSSQPSSPAAPQCRPTPAEVCVQWGYQEDEESSILPPPLPPGGGGRPVAPFSNELQALDPYLSKVNKKNYLNLNQDEWTRDSDLDKFL